MCFIASTAMSIAGRMMVDSAVDESFLSLWARHRMSIAAVLLFAIGAVGLLVAVAGYAHRSRIRLWVPVVTMLALFLAALGACALGAEHTITVLMAKLSLIIAAALGAAGALGCWADMRARISGVLTFAGLMAAAGGATLVIAQTALAPLPTMTATYPADGVLLPSMSLLLLGISISFAVQLHYMVARQVSRSTAAVALILLIASAIYPLAAVRFLSEADLVQLEPTGARFFTQIRWSGTVVLLLGIALPLAYAWRRWRLNALIPFTGAMLVFGLSLLSGVDMVLAPPDLVIMSSTGKPVYQLVFVAVALLAVGELTVMLGVMRYLFTFFTTVSIAGVTIGSMALVIVLSVMSGFETDLRNKILGSNAHMLITKEGAEFTEYRDIAARLERLPGVVATTPYLTSEVVIAANNSYANVIIKGIDPATVGAVTELADNTQQPNAIERLWPLAEDGGIIGPPRDAGVGGEPGEPEPGESKGEPADAATGETAVDPPPPGLDVDLDEPMDFSGGASAVEPGARTDAETGARTDADTQAEIDPAPADLDVDLDEPVDFSGSEPGEDAVAGDGGDSGIDLPIIEPGLMPDMERPLLDLDDPDARPRIPPRVAVLPGVLVGKELVKQNHLYVSQEVRIVSPLTEDTPAGPMPRTRFLRVAGTFFTGMYEYDLKFVYVPLDTLQSFLDVGDEVTGIEIRVKNPDVTGPTLRAIRDRLPEGYRVQDWKELNRNLFSALKLEKITMFLILAIIILVASYSIVGTLVMVVVEKAKEIALLKTLGASNVGVLQIFVTQGFFIGLAGTSLGLFHGLIACYLGAVYGLPLDPEVYYIDRLPIHVEGMTVLAIFGASILISVLATLYPAAVGARLRPIAGLRDE